MRRTLGVWILAAIAIGASARARAGMPGVIDDRDQASGRSTAAGTDPDPGPEAEASPPAPPPTLPSPSPSPSASHSPQSRGGRGDAQPAPAIPPPPTTSTATPDDAQRPLPPRRFSVMPRFAYRLGEGRAVIPAPGFGVSGTVEISYARLDAKSGTTFGASSSASGTRTTGVVPAPGVAPAPGPAGANVQLEAALGIDFSYDRFAIAEQGSAPVGAVDETFAWTRVLSETTFVLVHTIAVRVDRVRPYLTIGGGLGLGYFDSAARDLRPGSAQERHLLGRVGFGVDVSLARSWSAAVRLDYTAVHGASPLLTDSGRTLPLFGDLVDLSAGLAYRF